MLVKKNSKLVDVFQHNNDYKLDNFWDTACMYVKVFSGDLFTIECNIDHVVLYLGLYTESTSLIDYNCHPVLPSGTCIVRSSIWRFVTLCTEDAAGNWRCQRNPSASAPLVWNSLPSVDLLNISALLVSFKKLNYVFDRAYSKRIQTHLHVPRASDTRATSDAV